MLLKISDISTDHRARTDYGSIEELAASIRDNGLITPITVTPVADGKYRLVAGERRCPGGHTRHD